ncbi:hypothetical protein ACN47E_004365 [Coniothyrium glycines]
MSSNSPAPSQDLDYPPVRVDRSLTEANLDTLMMRSVTTPQAEGPGSSLDDSTYELLGESLSGISDDEGHTASIASTDGRTPDNASTFSDDDDYDGMDDTHVQDSIHSSHAELPEQHMPVAGGGDSSILTEVPAHMEGSDSMRQIKLDEQLAQGAEPVLGSKIIKSYWAHESPDVFGRYHCAELQLVVRAALSQHPMPTPDSYRVLYIGMPDKWLEDTIISKIGEALTASPRISKSVVVRGHIEPYNPPIHVWRCKEFRSVVEHGFATHVLAILDDGQQLRYGPKLKSSPEQRPDLVVFCHPTTLSTNQQDFTSASEVFTRENIPHIHIGQIRSHGAGAPAYDFKSLALCVEGRDNANDRYKMKEVLPIDHYAFSQLDPLQLNRHLASMSPHLVAQSNIGNYQVMHGSWLGRTFRTIRKEVGPNRSLLKSMAILLIILIMVPAVLQGIAFTPGLFQHATGVFRGSNISPTAELLTLCDTRPPLTAISTSLPVTHISSPATSELSLTPPQAKLPKRQSKKKDATTWRFEIETTSDKQFVLKPSKASAAIRKKPQLRISVLQGSQPVPIQYNRTIEGEYVVDLIRVYPSSTFNVSIVSYSKPLLQQSFNVCLGHNKTKAELLLDTVKTHLVETKTLLSGMSSSAMEQVLTSIHNLDAVADSCIGDTEGVCKQAARQLQQIQHVARRQSALGARLLKQVPGAAWIGVRHATASVRTSTPMKRARMNALRVRCKVETMAGISEKGDDESWACSKLREL